jgi:hypothetical protein
MHRRASIVGGGKVSIFTFKEFRQALGKCHITQSASSSAPKQCKLVAAADMGYGGPLSLEGGCTQLLPRRRQWHHSVRHRQPLVLRSRGDVAGGGRCLPVQRPTFFSPADSVHGLAPRTTPKRVASFFCRKNKASSSVHVPSPSCSNTGSDADFLPRPAIAAMHLRR